ncbi:MAG: amidohydrolase family protein [Opitutaceae bacterium]|nr:amidohydrolase family protein [Opitutaceae bacterium]
MIDGHVHLIGTGAGGTGCWIRLRGAQKALAPVLLASFGLTLRDLGRDDFDDLLVERLLGLIRAAGLRQVLLLAQEDVYTGRGERVPDRAAFYVPNERVLELARRHPEFVPAVSIHPARADALDELARCLEGGAAVMKCLPNCQDIDPRLPHYRRFWEHMAAAGLPLLAHTGGEKALPVVRPDLADPRVLEAPLECGVTVIAAHCGTTAGWGGRHWFPEFCAMLPKYPRLYGDISALALAGKGRFVRGLLAPGVVDRLVHGSDLPVPIQVTPMLLERQIGLRAWWRLRGIRNALARDIALKRALGFPEATFTRIESLWRRGGSR